MGVVERLGRGPGDLMFDPLIVDAIGRTPAGHEIERYSLRNGALRADVMTYGATLMRLETPDAAGNSENIVLGFDTLAPYLAGTPHIGATIGRYANRIAGAQFELDGDLYRLVANDGANHLHGGAHGFDKAVWSALKIDADGPGVAMRYVSADGEEGYPGALDVEVRFVLRSDRLSIAFEARSDRATHVNLTHHSYFNLSGAARRDVGGHTLQVEADQFHPVDDAIIPFGEAVPVTGTPFDFRRAHEVGDAIDANDPQLTRAGGYDHNFILNKPAGDTLALAAVLSEAQSGRRLAVRATAPGLQVYSGNHLDGAVGGFERRSGICLEPQHFPNSPNRPDYPSTVLRPGDAYTAQIELVFDILR